MNLETLLRYLDIGEDEEFECKSANWELPRNVWDTVSAFANTSGGYIILGVSEEGESLKITGVQDPDKLIHTFWSGHNNLQKMSTPICANSHVKKLRVEDHNIIVIQVPIATRQQRPVYVGNNPMTGTFKRNNEGDYHCNSEEIRQMLRDASGEPQDLKILEGFDLNDLDPETLKSFRQRFSSREPDHPWLAFDDRQLLCQLGGWYRNRSTNQEGLTLAGLLMFGRERSILDALPHFHLDYQEQLSNDSEQRWTHRLTVDGKWEPNLFNFYYRVYGRLVSNLDLPFQLNGDSVRRGETHVHEALREALVNALIHADHQFTRTIMVIKYGDGFQFTNPGRLRIPLQQLYEGGVSDPRNPNLQKMFQMIGLAERAGSGFQKILRAWLEQQWLYPFVTDDPELNFTSVAMPMVSFIPDNVEKELREIVGNDYSNLTELDRIILVLAHKSGEINNIGIQRYRTEHPREIGECLKRLVNNGWLEQSGKGRGTHYALPGQKKQNLPLLNSEHYESNSEHYESNSEHYESNSEHYGSNSEHYRRLLEISAPVRNKGRADKELVEQTILQLCTDNYLQLKELANLLARDVDSIRNHYVTPMLGQGSLVARYPSQPNHPQQAYKAALRIGG